MVRGHVFCGNGGSANDKEIHARFDHRAPVALSALGRQFAGDYHSGLADFLQARGDELRLDRFGVNLLQACNRVFFIQLFNFFQDGVCVLVPCPQTVEVEHANSTEFAELDRGFRTHHRVHGRCHDRDIHVVRVNLPADVDVLRIAGASGWDQCDVIERIGSPAAFSSADFNFIAHTSILAVRVDVVFDSHERCHDSAAQHGDSSQMPTLQCTLDIDRQHN